MRKGGMNRRRFLKLGLGAVTSAVACPNLGQAAAGTRPEARFARAEGDLPNVVYVMADQLRACSIGCYGNEEINTPWIDHVAGRGTRFANAVSTSPICTPHRACLMTGRYPTVTGVMANGDKLGTGEECLAEVFARHGYRTGYIGKWHLDGPVEDPRDDPGWVAPGDRQGFQYWLGYNFAHVYYDSKYYLGTDPTMRQTPPGVYEPDFQARAARHFIQTNRERPFFLLVSIGTPHNQDIGDDLPPGGPYTFPYDRDSVTLRPNVDYPFPDYARQEYADFYGITSNFDWNVGRIVRELDRQGLAENTIVVVTSDHGDVLGSHYGAYQHFRGKGVIYAESLNVPFVLRCGTAVLPPEVREVFTAVDVMPTLLGLCGLPAPEGVMGRDFSPLLLDGEEPGEPPYGPVPSTETALVGCWGRQAPFVGAHTAQYSLACDPETLEPELLFDNSADPFQMANLVDDPDHAPVREALLEDVAAWLDYIEA